MTSVKNLYDSYVRAIRWASDRIEETGVVAFVCNASFVDSSAMDGLRACMADEFQKVLIIHLRGNQRTKGELSRREGGKIFGSGSRAPIAVSIFVKSRKRTGSVQTEILLYDIGDYLTRDEKLQKLSELISISTIERRNEFQQIKPDKHFDWVNQRDGSFHQHIAIGDKSKGATSRLFSNYSLGLATGRDAWCVNSAKSIVESNMTSMIAAYNSEVGRSITESYEGDTEDFIDTNPAKISWNRNLKEDFEKRKKHEFQPNCIVKFLYRPFHKQWVYFNRGMNAMVYQLEKLFPQETTNLCVSVSGRGAKSGFSALITSTLPCLDTIEKGQCFPLFVHKKESDDLFGAGNEKCAEAALTDFGFEKFSQEYSDTNSITKEDLFYYIYGLLHSPEYRERYKDNLSKELPRIPAVKKFEDFQAFSQAGRDLAHWHLDYETVDCHEVTLDVTDSRLALEKHNIVVPKTGTRALRKKVKLTDEHFYVRKMKFPKTTDPETKKRVNDKTTVIYNEYITVGDIPLSAYDYVVNGKPAIEWVMERQALTTDKKSGIVNDANLWATETMNNAAYPLELLLRVITVSLETMKIISGLPKLDID